MLHDAHISDQTDFRNWQYLCPCWVQSLLPLLWRRHSRPTPSPTPPSPRGHRARRWAPAPSCWTSGDGATSPTAPAASRSAGRTLCRTSREPLDAGRLSPGCLWRPLASKGGGGDGGGDEMGARRRGWAGGGGCAGRRRSTGPLGRRALCEEQTVWRRRTAGRSCSRRTEGNFSDSSETIRLRRQNPRLLHKQTSFSFFHILILTFLLVCRQRPLKISLMQFAVSFFKAKMLNICLFQLLLCSIINANNIHGFWCLRCYWRIRYLWRFLKVPSFHGQNNQFRTSKCN